MLYIFYKFFVLNILTCLSPILLSEHMPVNYVLNKNVDFFQIFLQHPLHYQSTVMPVIKTYQHIKHSGMLSAQVYYISFNIYISTIIWIGVCWTGSENCNKCI